MPPKNKNSDKIHKWQNISAVVFVPAAGIAIFSDNWIFETIAFVTSIIFATLMYVDSRLD